MTKLKSNNLPNVFVKKLKICKCLGYLEKHIFKQKLRNQEGVIISNQGKPPRGIFFVTFPLHFIWILCLHWPLDKIHTWKLFTCGKIFAHENSKAEKSPWVGKKTGPKKKEEYHSVKKRKKSLVIKQLVLCYTLASRFQTSHHETKIYYTLSLTQGSFLFMQAPAMIWIHLQLPRIIILKALHQLVVLLLSTSGFSIFIGSF